MMQHNPYERQQYPHAIVPISPASPAPMFYTPTAISMHAVRPASGLAVWALVMGLVGIFAGWCLLAIPNLAAIALGHFALADTKSGEKTGRGMGVAGLALGYVSLLPVIVFWLWILGAGVAGAAA